MGNDLTSSPEFTIRSPANQSEIDIFISLNAQIFRPDEDVELVIKHRRNFLLSAPDFDPSQLRCAFLGEVIVGGYIMRERIQAFGAARLRTACIGGVVTHPDYRRQGISSALMFDAVNTAQSKQLDLLLLHGIQDFYHQFGYVKSITDLPQHAIERVLLPQQSPEDYAIRLATPDDAQALLDLYHTHYDSYTGSFAPARSLARQIYLLTHWFQDNIPLLAFDAASKLQGYLLLSYRRQKLYAYEAAIHSWPAALALLQYHAQLLDNEAEPPAELKWPFPPQSKTFYTLADHLPVRSEYYTHPNGGWMARPAHLPTFLHSLLPLWQERWQNAAYSWSGNLTFTIDSVPYSLEFKPGSVKQIEQIASTDMTVKFSSQIFTQLLFGYRPVSWAQQQPGQAIPETLLPVLSVLFQPTAAWIAGSDFF